MSMGSGSVESDLIITRRSEKKNIKGRNRKGKNM